MDVLTDEQALQAVLDRELAGIDNEALDFQIEDYINSDGSLCLPDDPLPAVSYTSPISINHLHHQHQQQQHCRVGPHPSARLVAECGHLSAAVPSVQPQGGGKQCSSAAPDLHSHIPPHLQMIHHPLSQHSQIQHHHHHPQQQQQQQQQQQHQQQCQLQPVLSQHHQLQQQQLLQQTAADNGGNMYSSCGMQLSQTGRITYDHHPHPLHHQQMQHNSTPLPDSPPDSGSEPYSPLDDSAHTFDSHQTQGMAEGGGARGLPTIPQVHHLSPQHRMTALPDLGLGHKLPPAYLGGTQDPPKFSHNPQGLPQPSGGGLGLGMVGTPPGMGGPPQMPPTHGGLAHTHPPLLPYLPNFGSINNLVNQPNKKRRMSDSPTNTINTGMMPHGMNGVLIKQEPPGPSSMTPFSHSFVGDCSNDDDFSYEMDSNLGFVEGSYQVIKWQSFNATSWITLTDANFKDLPLPTYRVDADKGFNFSVPDESFVCQKKNHFQVTVHVGLQGNPKYVRTPDGVKKIEDFFVHFYGVKMESPTQNIKIEQSQSDRSKRPFHPVKVDPVPDQIIKLTVGRLHFSETTSNNMRKKGKPNPDQRYFKLVVALHAQSGQNSYLICAHSSERIIVRSISTHQASNPGQFDNEVDVLWQKGHTGESVYHVGRVGVNTDHPEEALTVHGNMRLTGHLLQPSDMRAKEKIEEVDSKGQLENVQKLRIYRYEYKEEYADHAGMHKDDRHDTGVLAQEIIDVLPDAVRSTGDVRLASGHTMENFLVVNKDRIFMENVGAVKELCKLTDNLEVRIDELEKMNKRLASLKRFDSIKSTYSAKSTASTASTLSASAATPPHNSSSSSNGHKSRGSSNNSRSRHHSHRDHHGRRSSNSTLSSLMHMNKMCGNRFLQVIIFILILIMAFCLIAITTLYIMELHKQRAGDSSSAPVIQGTQAPHTTSEPPGRHTTSGNGSIPLVPEQSKVNDSSTITPPPTTSKNSATSTTTTKPSSPKSTESPPVVIPSLAPYPPCERDQCETYCCPLPPEDDPFPWPYHPQVVIGGGGDDNPFNNIDSGGDGEEANLGGGEGGEGLDTTGNHNDMQNQNGVVSMTIPSGPPTHSTSNSTSTNSNTNTNDVQDIQLVVSDNGNKGPAYHVVNSVHNMDKIGASNHHLLYKRQAADSVAIVVQEMNVTLDGFCVDGCQGNNQTYNVLLAPYFFMDAITLQFRMSQPVYVALCDARVVAVCEGAGTYTAPGNDAKNGSVVEFPLRVGAHVHSSYSFRVVDGLRVRHNTTEICTLRSTAGLVIKDYLLKFRRSCDGPY